MMSIFRAFSFVTLLGVVAAYMGIDAHTTAQPPAQQIPRVETGLTVACEVFCSTTKLRTSNARVRWNISKAALDAHRITTLASARQTLEATVYKNGFDKGLLVSFPIGAATPARAVAPQIAQPAQARLRAFQIQLISIEPPAAQAGAAGDQMTAVIENLEPGVNYTWRVAIETAAGRIVSAPITCEAPVCPADIVRGPGGAR
jgi:hypothetical protein